MSAWWVQVWQFSTELDSEIEEPRNVACVLFAFESIGCELSTIIDVYTKARAARPILEYSCPIFDLDSQVKQPKFFWGINPPINSVWMFLFTYVTWLTSVDL